MARDAATRAVDAAADRPSRPAPFAAPRAAPRHRLALVVDPRFPGGTPAAVAAEIDVLAPRVALAVVGLETAMFRGRAIHPAIADALDRHGLALAWDPPVVHADTIVVHNPSCLKFDSRLATRLSCRAAYVVTHENFLRPGGAEAFDVGLCLELIDRALVCGTRRLVPVSPWNRRCAAAWLARTGAGWRVAEFDWFNICDAGPVPPSDRPRDRRGRHSRPGLEKFPPLADMRAHFPAHAERCAILGADRFLADPRTLPRHWTALRFGSMDVARFLAGIDFFVYFTNPRWRESFGRVIAEAIAAGKLVITDPATAEPFGDAVVASDGRDVDAIVRGFVADPARYVETVEAGQSRLGALRPDAFARNVLARVASVEPECDACL